MEPQRRSLQVAADDSLVVLAGIDGGSALQTGLAEALDCAIGAAPSPTGCMRDGRPTNLSLRFDGYLPTGIQHRVGLDNGHATRELYATGVPSGERVASALAFTPTWDMGFLLVDLSCHDPTMDVNVSLLPLWHADAAPTPSRVAVAAGAALEAEAVAVPSSGLWNATLPPAAIGEAVSSRITAARGDYLGTASTASCDLGPQGWLLRDALNQSAAAAIGTGPAGVVPLGRDAAVAYDFASIPHLVPGATLLGVEVRVHAPLTARPQAADAFLHASPPLEAGADWAGVATWTADPASFFGTHPVVVAALLSVPGPNGDVEVEARLLTTLTVALPGGIVPLDPPYRFVLEAWQPEWR